MKNWTIRRRIVASFAVILALMGAMGAVTHTLLRDIERQAQSMEDGSLPGLDDSYQLVVIHVADYSLTQSFVLQPDMAARQKLKEAILAKRGDTNPVVAKYAATIFTAADQELFRSYKNAQDKYSTVQDGLLKTGLDPTHHGEDLVSQLTSDLAPVFAAVQAAAEAVVDLNRSDAVESTRLIGASVHRARVAVLLSLGVGLVVAGVFGFFLLRAITQPLGRLVTILDVMRTGDLSGRLNRERGDEFGTVANGFNRMTDDLVGLVGQVQLSGVQVNTSVTEIAATAREQQATASEIAATTSEIGATSREISSRSQQLLGTMNEVATVAEQSAILAGEGRVSLTHMEATMHRVIDAAAAINGKLQVLNEKAGNISQVVITITKVADQTNLLSLNAAIEAEKAGEYGRGFAVVATEIRRLADQTAVATFDIELMVKEIQSAVAAGVMGMDKFSEEVRHGMKDVQQVGEQLSQVIQQVQALAPQMESVNDGMEAQASGAEQITQALAQLSEAAQQTVDSLRQSGQAIDELNQVAIGLRGGVSRFTLQAA